MSQAFPKPRSGPLSHLKVLDLSRVLAGPWAGQVLADMGAQVIKVERPGAGDDTRVWGPPFLKDAEGRETREACYFLAANRGKRSVTLDISRPEGQEIVRRLAADADIVLENYKVGTLAKFGLDYESLKAVRPDIIYCSVTGFGQTGPLARLPAYDFMIQAMGGLMSVTGERDGEPGGGPQKVGMPIIDVMTGMWTAVGVLGALAQREKTGQGDYIDLAMLDVMVATIANQGMNYLVSGKTPRRMGNKHPNIQPQDVFTCSDGKQMVLAVGNDGQFAAFCEAVGAPQLARDPRYALNSDRVVNLQPLMAFIRAEIGQRPRPEIIELLRRHGVPCSPINDIAEILQEPQILHREMLRYLDHPTAGKVPQIVSPLRFQQMPLAFDEAPPLLGADTDAVLADIGMGAGEIAALRAGGVV
ncbi:CoA transferase [Xylophilus rhododendri]|uniref:CoA transferase n=1 Tax=Xylophilus rhododendri TaxID=2697032 RepID=A0A857JCX2_9BURK|nr:CaiB/BaiF CoA-transferase family protein [Xylophilus rhododendri]QHJ00526.1 CoA transferase [Xylophilus rhododendri]